MLEIVPVLLQATPSVTVALDNSTINSWAQTIVTALTSPMAIIVGVSVGGLIMGRIRRLF